MNSRLSRTSAWGLALALGFAVLLPACGSSTPDAPPVPQRSVIGTGSFSNLGVFPNDYAVQTFTLGSAGAVDATVNWTFSSDDVDILIGRGDCFADNLQCSVVAQAQTFNKPERVQTGSLSAGLYSLVIVNRGPGTESVSFEIGVTR